MCWKQIKTEAKQILEKLQTPNESQDSGYSWVICAGVFMVLLCTSGFVEALGLVYQQFLADFNQSRGETAFVISLVSGLRFFVGPFSGVLTSRFGPRIVTCYGGLVIFISLNAASLCTSLGCLYVTFGVVFSIGASLAFTASVAVISMYFNKRKSLAFGIATSGSCFGTIIFTFILRHLLSSIKWQGTFRVISMPFGLICLVSGILYLPRKESPAFITDELPPKKSSARLIKEGASLLKNVAFCVFLLALFVRGLHTNVASVHAVQFSVEFGFALSKATLLPVYMAFSSAFGRIVIGALVDHNFANVLGQYQVVLFAHGIISLLGIFVMSYLQLVTYFLITYLFDGALQGLVLVALSYVVPRDRLVHGWSLVMFVQSISMCLGPTILGWMVDKTNDYSFLFYLAGVPSLISGLVIFGVHAVKFKERREYIMSLDETIFTTFSQVAYERLKGLKRETIL